MKFTLVGVLVEVHDGDGLGVDLFTVGDEVHIGGSLVDNLHVVGDEVLNGGPSRSAMMDRLLQLG